MGGCAPKGIARSCRWGDSLGRRVDARKILRDIRAGITRGQLMDKYSLSESDLKRVFQEMARERKARAEAIASDLRKGLSTEELIAKYELSEEGFQKIAKTLLDEGFIRSTDLPNGIVESCNSVVLQLRRTRRYQPRMSVTVCDKRNPAVRCILKDVSEHGLSIIGLKATVSEIRKIAVLGDEFGAVSPFEFEAQCRWTGKEDPEDQPVAGFQVVSISRENLVRLRDLIKKFSLPIDGDGREAP
jgi:uncharacterized protein (DUF433 family)